MWVRIGALPLCLVLVLALALAAGCATTPEPGSPAALQRLLRDVPWTAEAVTALAARDYLRVALVLEREAEAGDPWASELRGILGTALRELVYPLPLRAGLGMAAVEELLALGVGGADDLSRTRAWLEAEAARGRPDAPLVLAHITLLGIGAERDEGEAFRLAKAADDAELCEASYLVGIFLWYGTGTEPDPKAARKAWERASRAGHTGAMVRLAMAHLMAKPPDPKAAERWARAAANHDNPEGQHFLGLLALDRRDPEEAMEWMTRAAERHHVGAQEKLGSAYLTGLGVERDYDLARRWLEPAAAAGDAAAMNQMGVLYANGWGVEEDPELAVEWYRRSAEAGHPAGQFNLGWRYAEGLGVPRDPARARDWYEKSANQGDVKARGNLAVLLWEGPEALRDPKRALALWQGLAKEGVAPAMRALALAAEVEGEEDAVARWVGRAAEAGDVESQAWYGNLHLRGAGVEKSREKAVLWWQKAAEQGEPQARFNLAVHLLERSPERRDEALALLEASAAQGFTDAQTRLALLRGRDHPDSLSLLRASAEDGDAMAMNELATAYADGRGVARDGSAAASWYRKALERGELRAAVGLGALYESGLGVPKDPIEALRLYRRAAEAGLPGGHLKVGDAYKEGRGVRKNLGQAIAHWRIAAEGGHEIAQFNLAWALITTGRDVPEGARWLEKAAEQDMAQAQLVLSELYLRGHGVPRDLARARAWVERAEARDEKGAAKVLRLIEAEERKAGRTFRRPSAPSGP